MVKVDQAQLGMLLRRYREEQGLSQEALAELAGAGVSVNTIGNIERSRTRPYRHTLEALCDALRLDERERAEALAAWRTAPERARAQADPSRPAALPDWLPLTKFSPPAVRPDIVLRSRLMDILRGRLESYRLVLVSAPAGSGKTTLVASTLHGLPARSMWVALDEEDNDPARFLALLIAGVRRLQPDAGSTAQQLLGTQPSLTSYMRQVVGALINDLAADPDPLVLVLDDLHRITEPAIFVALDYFLERLPPQVHLAIITRHDPPLALARLRARGEVAEVRFSDLRFTPEETARLLAEHHSLDLSSEDLSLVEEQLEGWVAGLCLLVNALDRETPARRAAFLRGATRMDRQMFAFLTEEVLSHEPESTQRFLLETSILTHLTPSLCGAVTGRDDAAEVLDDLERRNLFVTALDELGELTFRYHDLFAQFLRHQLERVMPERIPDLHQRAGQAHPVPTEAIDHLLEGGLWDHAADRIEVVGYALLDQGLLVTLLQWLDSLPAAVRDARPGLLFLQGVCMWHQRRAEAALALLQRAVAGYAAAERPAEEAQVLAFLAGITLWQGKNDTSAEMAARALERPLPPLTRLTVVSLRALARLLRGEESGVAAEVEEFVNIGLQLGGDEALAALVTYHSPAFSTLPGCLDRLERICELASAQWGDRATLAQQPLEDQWCLVQFWRGRFNAALQSGEHAIRLTETWGVGNPVLHLFALCALGVIQAGRGHEDEALHYLQQARDYASQTGLGMRYQGMVLYPIGWVHWLHGRYDEARSIYGEMCRVADPSERAGATVWRVTLRGLLEMVEGRHSEAVEHLQEAARHRIASTDLLVDPRLWLAAAYLTRGQIPQALDTLRTVLGERRADGMSGLILREGPPMIPLLRLAIEAGAEAPFAERLLQLLETPH